MHCSGSQTLECKVGDIITELNGKKLDSAESLQRLLRDAARRSDKTETINISLPEWEAREWGAADAVGRGQSPTARFLLLPADRQFPLLLRPSFQISQTSMRGEQEHDSQHRQYRDIDPHLKQPRGAEQQLPHRVHPCSEGEPALAITASAREEDRDREVGPAR